VSFPGDAHGSPGSEIIRVVPVLVLQLRVVTRKSLRASAFLALLHCWQSCFGRELLSERRDVDRRRCFITLLNLRYQCRERICIACYIAWKNHAETTMITWTSMLEFVRTEIIFRCLSRVMIVICYTTWAGSRHSKASCDALSMLMSLLARRSKD